jgi:hypothetical protein
MNLKNFTHYPLSIKKSGTAANHNTLNLVSGKEFVIIGESVYNLNIGLSFHHI